MATVPMTLPDAPLRPVRRSGNRNAVRAALVLGLYLVPAIVAYGHAWAHPASVAIGSGNGDPAQSMWYLKWVPWAIGHGQNPLFTTLANYPRGVNVVVQTSTLALGLAVSPITLLWGPVAAYNLLITLAFPLSAGAGYLLARRFTTWRPAAFVAGLFYGFSPYMVGQGLGHLNLVFVPLPPLIFLVLHTIVVRQTGSPLRWGLALGGLAVCQFFISTEILATTVLFAGVAVLVVALANPSALRLHARFACIGLGVAAVVAAALLAYPIHVLLSGPQHVSGPTPGFENYTSAFFGPLLPPSTMALSTPHLRQMAAHIGGDGAENGSYLGVPAVLLVVIGTLVVRRRAVWVAASLALVGFVISIGSHFRLGIPSLAGFGSSVPLPALRLGQVPLLQDAYPARYTLYIALFASLVIAMTLEALRARLAQRRRALVVPAVVAVVTLLPLVPAWPYPSQGPVAVPSYFSSAAVDSIPPGSVTVAYPWPDNKDNRAQLWQAAADLRFRMPGGYFIVPSGPSHAFSYAPVTLASTVLDQLALGPVPSQTPALRRRLRDEFGGWKVQSIVVLPPTGAPLAFFTWLTGQAPGQVSGGVAVWYHLRWKT
ncbi:MAG TPA: hypothetical protein VG184_10275 [Acidimicrobiales bacterium]|jgi:hypothetical protein|nr:hypothetical protein [Acidimicrobiales bacterium]